MKKKRYWNLKDIAQSNISIRNNSQKTFYQEKEELKILLEKTVLKQTISDVQIGSFLSGGVDSSVAAVLLHKEYR